MQRDGEKMNLSDKELQALRMLIKTEMMEVEDMITALDGKDQDEMKDYLSIIEEIRIKLN